MPTDLENLQAYLSKLYAELGSITPGRSYSIDGQAVDHEKYEKSLLERIAATEARITALQGPFEVDIQGIG